MAFTNGLVWRSIARLPQLYNREWIVGNRSSGGERPVRGLLLSPARLDGGNRTSSPPGLLLGGSQTRVRPQWGLQTDKQESHGFGADKSDRKSP